MPMALGFLPMFGGPGPYGRELCDYRDVRYKGPKTIPVKDRVCDSCDITEDA